MTAHLTSIIVFLEPLTLEFDTGNRMRNVDIVYAEKMKSASMYMDAHLRDLNIRQLI